MLNTHIQIYENFTLQYDEDQKETLTKINDQ